MAVKRHFPVQHPLHNTTNSLEALTIAIKLEATTTLDPVKCRKCYQYIFWFLFDVAITNSFILCKEFSPLKIHNVKTFRVELVKQLNGNYNSRKRPGDLASLLLSSSAKSISPHMAVTRAIAVITVLSTRKNARSQCGFVKTAGCTSGTGQDCVLIIMDGEHNHSVGCPMDGTPPQSEDR